MPKAPSTSFPVRGMVFSLDPLAIPEDAYATGINVAMDKQALRQRDGYREIPLRSDTEGLVDEFKALNLQGAIAYSPSRGQSALQFSSKGDYLAIAAAGRKFLVEVMGRGAGAYGKLVEVTGGAPQAPDLHMCWMAEAENYLIAGDDFGQTWVYDGVETAFLSSGYDPSNPEASRVPNRARLPVYSHGRLCMTVGARSALIGDVIHGDGKTDASAILNFIEQVYWATGAEFTMPTESKAILAAYNLPTLGRSSDHGELVLETENRSYALRTQIYPRTSWIDTPNMVVTVALGGGARGPWAFDTYVDNAVRRTLHGVQTLSFSRAGADDLSYSPQEDLSGPVEDFLEGDYGPWLRFNSTKVDPKAKRLYSTVRPWIYGAHWKHRGILTYNYKRKIWEGINTAPEPVKDIKSIIPLGMSGEERIFVLAGNDESGDHIRVLEIEQGLREDVLSEGAFPIASTVQTRAIYGDLDEEVSINGGTLQFSDVSGDVHWRVLWKSDWSQGCWTLWNEGTISHDEKSAPTVKPVEIGQFNGREVNGVRKKTGVHFEFLIQWSGKATYRFHQVDASMHVRERANVLDDPECTEDLYCCDENSDLLTPWL